MIYPAGKQHGVLRVAGAGVNRRAEVGALEQPGARRDDVAGDGVAQRVDLVRATAFNNFYDLPRGYEVVGIVGLRQTAEGLDEVPGVGGSGVQEVLCGDEKRLCAGTAGAQPFDRAEVEGLILYDGPAYGAAELVAHEVALQQTVGVIVEGRRRERRAAIELVGAAVDAVGSRFGDGVDADGVAAELRRRVVGLDAELLHRVERYSLAHAGVESVVVGAAVEHEVDR